MQRPAGFEVEAGVGVVVEAVADDGVHGAVGPHVEEQWQEDVEEDVWFVAGGTVEG